MRRELRARCSVSSEHPAASVPGTVPRQVPSTLPRQFRALCRVSSEHLAASVPGTVPRQFPAVMRKVLLQLDSSPHASVFDRIVALDAGADEVLSYGGVAEEAVRDLVHGEIFTRSPKNLHHSAIFVGGTDMAAGERLLTAVRKEFFGPMRVSVMLDS